MTPTALHSLTLVLTHLRPHPEGAERSSLLLLAGESAAAVVTTRWPVKDASARPPLFFSPFPFPDAHHALIILTRTPAPPRFAEGGRQRRRTGSCCEGSMSGGAATDEGGATGRALVGLDSAQATTACRSSAAAHRRPPVSSPSRPPFLFPSVAHA
jgi:hypothetical protein